MAHFKEAKIDNLDWSEECHLNRSLIEELCECDWIDSERKSWGLLYGASGCGKSFLAQVFGYAACLNGYNTRYIRTSLLTEEMQETIDKHRITAYRKTLNKRKLLILDDFRLGNINDTVGENALTIIDERLGVSSLIISSQIQPKFL